jgi:hypothetical protein
VRKFWVSPKAPPWDGPPPTGTIYAFTEADLASFPERFPESGMPPVEWKGSDRQWRTLVILLERDGFADFRPLLQEDRARLLRGQREMVAIFEELINRHFLLPRGKAGAVGFLAAYFVSQADRPLSKGALDQAAHIYHHHRRHAELKAAAVRFVLSLQEINT